MPDIKRTKRRLLTAGLGVAAYTALESLACGNPVEPGCPSCIDARVDARMDGPTVDAPVPDAAPDADIDAAIDAAAAAATSAGGAQP